MKNAADIVFLKSALTLENPFITLEGVIEWIREQNNKVELSIEKINFNQLDSWYFDTEKKNYVTKVEDFFL